MSHSVEDEDREKILVINDWIKQIRLNLLQMEKEMERQYPEPNDVREYAAKIKNLSEAIINEI